MISGNGENNGNGNPFAVKRAGRRLDELFDAHGASILHLCRLILRDPVEAEDAAQQTFLSAYRALLRGTTPREPEAWLAQIARNECRARLRRRELAAVPLEVEPEDARDAVDVAAGHEQLQAVASAIQELPTRQRQAVVLSDLRGLSNDEVARAMSLAPGTVEALLYRGRLRVRRAFRRSWPATVVVPAWLRDAFVRLAGQLETSLSAAPAARVAAAVAVAVVAAGAATIEIEHQQARPRSPRVHPVTRETPVAAPRHSAMSEMVSLRRERPVQVETRRSSVGQATSGPGRHGREDERSERGPSPPHTATPVSSSSGPGPSSPTQQTSVVSSSGPGPAPTTQPASTDNSGPASHESAGGETVAQPDSSGPSVESSSSGPSLESSSAGSGSNSGPGSDSSGSSGPSLESSSSGSGSNSGPGSDSSVLGSSGSDSSGSSSDSSGSSSDSSGSGSSGSDSSGSGGDGHSGSGG